MTTDLRKFSPLILPLKWLTDLCKFSRPPTIPFNTINTIYSANYYSAAEEEVGEEEEVEEEGGKVEKINLKMGRSAQPNLRSLVYLVYTAGNTFTDKRSSTLYSSEKQWNSLKGHVNKWLLSGNKIVRANQFAPSDPNRAEIERPGARNLIVDPNTYMMYYTIEDGTELVREPLSFDTPAGKVFRFPINLNNFEFYTIQTTKG